MSDNRRLLEVWVTTLEQAIGKNLYELGYPQWHADMHMRELRQLFETRRPVKGEVPFTRSENDLTDGLETIERNARAQTQIIEDLLDMSRIISGKLRLDVLARRSARKRAGCTAVPENARAEIQAEESCENRIVTLAPPARSALSDKDADPVPFTPTEIIFLRI
jgi:signal transduction histidine kinase